MLSLQWVIVVQKICPTDGLWASWSAQLVDYYTGVSLYSVAVLFFLSVGVNKQVFWVPSRLSSLKLCAFEYTPGTRYQRAVLLISPTR